MLQLSQSGSCGEQMPEECRDVLRRESEAVRTEEGTLIAAQAGLCGGNRSEGHSSGYRCSQDISARQSVPRNKYLDKFVSVQCVHGDHVSYPLAKVKVVIDGRSYFVEAAVVKKLPASVLLGRDVPELVQISGATEEVLAAMTRAQAKRRSREEESASKKEESGVRTYV